MSLKSWISIPRGSHFSLANIPFGIISTNAKPAPRPAIAIGDSVLDLDAFATGDGFNGLENFRQFKFQKVFAETTLNTFAALGRPVHEAVRKYLQDVFADDTPFPDVLKENENLKEKAIFLQKDVRNQLPMEIGDYTDFFAGVNHAFNVSTSNVSQRGILIDFKGRDSLPWPRKCFTAELQASARRVSW